MMHGRMCDSAWRYSAVQHCGRIPNYHSTVEKVMLVCSACVKLIFVYLSLCGRPHRYIERARGSHSGRPLVVTRVSGEITENGMLGSALQYEFAVVVLLPIKLVAQRRNAVEHPILQRGLCFSPLHSGFSLSCRVPVILREVNRGSRPHESRLDRLQELNRHCLWVHLDQVYMEFLTVL